LIKLAFPTLIYLLETLEETDTEYLFIDATPMAVCHNLREKRHKVFKGLAKKGKTSTGWFFGFKLHFIFNTYGEIVIMQITGSNIDDRSPVMTLYLPNLLAIRVISLKNYQLNYLTKRLP
jgi:hypothetical protein